MGKVMLPEQILAVIVAVRGTYDHVHMLLSWRTRIRGKVAQVGRRLMVKLDENHGNVSRTAEVLGLERSHLYRKMKTLGIAAKE